MKITVNSLLLGLTLLMVTFLSAAVAQEAPEVPSTVEDALTRLKAFEPGQENEAMALVISEVMASQGDPARRTAIASRLAALLSENVSFECKKFICRQLFVIGDERQAPALSAMLTDEACGHLARFALERMPGKTIDTLFYESMDKATGNLKAGLVTAIAARHNPQSVPKLTALVADADPAVALAAAVGLGVQGDSASAAAIAGLLNRPSDDLREALIDSYLKCAENLIVRGKKNDALAIYEVLYGAQEALHVRLAAFHGIVKLKGEESITMVVDAIKSPDIAWQKAGFACVRTFPGRQATGWFVGLSWNLSPEPQALLIRALADRGDRSALPAAETNLANPSPIVRHAAISAMGALGDASCAVPLLNMIVAAEGEEQALIRESLYLVKDKYTDAALCRAMKTGDAPLRIEVLRALAAREAKASVPEVLAQTKDAEWAVRQEACRALGILATSEDMPVLIAMLVQAPSNEDRDAAETAIINTARRIDPAQGPVNGILQALTEVKDEPARTALMRVLGSVADPKGLDILLSTVKTESGSVRDAALKAVTDWPTDVPMGALLDLARTGADAGVKDAALQGYIRMFRMKTDRPVEESVQKLDEAISLAVTPGAKQAVLSALSVIPNAAALAIVERFLGDAEVAGDAARAAENIRRTFYSATASANAEGAARAIDNKGDTRWDTGAMQQPGQWFQLDMSAEATVRGVVLDCAGSPQDFPRGYEVYVFSDPATPGNAVAAGAAEKEMTEIRFEPVKGRYVKIVQTGQADQVFWSIHELRIIP